MTQPILNHPLALNTKIRAAVTGCACRGGRIEIVEGIILKVILNHTGTWYYINTGRTVKDSQIQCTL
jgi:hypothetical protein